MQTDDYAFKMGDKVQTTVVPVQSGTIVNRTLVRKPGGPESRHYLIQCDDFSRIWVREKHLRRAPAADETVYCHGFQCVILDQLTDNLFAVRAVDGSSPWVRLVERNDINRER